MEPLICPECTADLDVPAGVTVLCCRMCGSKLRLRETESVRALVVVQEPLPGARTGGSRREVGQWSNLAAGQRSKRRLQFAAASRLQVAAAIGIVVVILALVGYFFGRPSPGATPPNNSPEYRYNRLISEAWREVHAIEDKATPVQHARKQIEIALDAAPEIKARHPEIYQSARFLDLKQAYLALEKVQLAQRSTSSLGESLEDLKARRDIVVLTFRIQRRFDTSGGLGVYEATRDYITVVLAVPEANLPEDVVARAAGVRLTVRDEGEQPIEMRTALGDRYVEYYRRYRWTDEEPSTSEQIEEQSKQIEDRQSALDEAWRALVELRKTWPKQ